MQHGPRRRYAFQKLPSSPRASQDDLVHLVLRDPGKITEMGECLAEFTDLDGLRFIVGEFACTLYDHSKLPKLLQSCMRTLRQVNPLLVSE